MYVSVSLGSRARGARSLTANRRSFVGRWEKSEEPNFRLESQRTQRSISCTELVGYRRERSLCLADLLAASCTRRPRSGGFRDVRSNV